MSAISTQPPASESFLPGEDFALRMDSQDPLRSFRTHFHVPPGSDAKPCAYLCGNSLGLQPRRARDLLIQELDDWARLGVEGHFHAARPWYSYHELFRESGARLVGARPGEVVMMNTLTVNLHLLMMSFYRPQEARLSAVPRIKVLMEEPAFPSDTYAIQTHLRARGVDPEKNLLVIRPRSGEYCVRTEDIEAALLRDGPSIALVLLSGVNFLTGQVIDIPRIAIAAQKAGAVFGLDLAHAAGNIVMNLHDWNVDFAAWCSYKYLNAGPGAIAGAFVHSKHAHRADLPRFAGWWGNDPATRFKMQLIENFHPHPGAEGWQVSNPPIFSLTPLLASLELFDQAALPRLREKSLLLTGYLRWLLDRLPADRLHVITPRDEQSHGCQLSITLSARSREVHHALTADNIITDFREPNIIRVAPVPLYNSFHDAWRCAAALARALKP